MNSSSNYNIFNGFGYKDIDIEPTDEQRTNFQLYLKYLKKYVCGNDEAQYDYFMSNAALMIQEPKFKNQICQIFYSNEKGTGKSSFCKLMRKLIGSEESFIGNVRTVMEKHSTSNQFKLLNIIEELDQEMGEKTYEQLKDKIQADVCNINRKNKDIIELDDYVKYIITTNNCKSIPIDSDNRRFVVYHFKKTESKEIINLITEVYENSPTVYTKLLGEYLESYKIKFGTRSEWIEKRAGSNKIKSFYKTNQLDQFFSNIHNEDDEIQMGNFEESTGDRLRISKTGLYKVFKEWTEYAVMSKANFYKKIATYDFIEQVKYCGIFTYYINTQGLESFIKESDIDCNDEEYVIQDDTMGGLSAVIISE
jgi:phage/plasmid-associated DNA primase